MRGDKPKPKFDRQSRRAFLKTAGSVGAVAVSGVGVAGAVPAEKRVPKYLRGDEVVQWMKVPRAWLAQDRKAHAALEALNKSHMGREGIRETGLVRSEQTFGGWNGFEIEVVIDKTKPKPDLPNEVSDVAVRVREEHPSERELQACKNIGNWFNYRGGVNIFDDGPNSSTRALGTSGYRAVNNGTEYMVTAMHTFGDCAWTSGDNTYQLDYQLGEIQDGDVRADFVASDSSGSNMSISNKVREPDGTTRTISGCASEEEISRRVSDWFDGYTKIGVSTGKTTGGLGKKDITVNKCNDLRGEGVRGSTDGAKGDSGGPYYSVENGDAFMLAHHVFGTGGDAGYTVTCGGQTLSVTAKTIGMPCYWVNNNGYQIGV